MTELCSGGAYLSSLWFGLLVLFQSYQRRGDVGSKRKIIVTNKTCSGPSEGGTEPTALHTQCTQGGFYMCYTVYMIKTSVKDFFLNFGAIVALYTVVVALLNLLFTVINVAYPQITNDYNLYGYGSQSISWPVSILIIFSPIFLVLMWLLEKEYAREPEKKNTGIHKWLAYITLFISGLTLAGDLVAVLYYFIDGQELTAGFLLKVLAVLVVALSVFMYYIADLRGKLTPASHKMWRIIAGLIIVGAIVWGFAVLGSPRTQQLIKYDQQKISDLQNIESEISSYVNQKGVVPTKISDLTEIYYSANWIDSQTGKQYEYEKINATSYKLCAEFNKELSVHNSPELYAYAGNTGDQFNHPAGHYCFETDNVTPLYPIQKPIPLPM
jgi:hypothetical protein